MNALQRIEKRLNAAGILDTYQDTATSGQYFDGTDHETTAPALRVYVKNRTDAGRRDRETVERLAARCKSLAIVWRYGYDTNRATITTKADREKLLAGQRRADRFLAAFWQSMHDTAGGTMTDRARQAAAIQAGRAAIERATSA